MLLNNACPRCLAGYHRNKVQLNFVGGIHVCLICDHIATSQECGIVVVCEYDTKADLLSIHYDGNHLCEVNLGMESMKDYILEAIRVMNPLNHVI